MGKTEKNRTKVNEKNGRLEFEVLVRVHGKRAHTEKYGIPVEHVQHAKELGYLDGKEKNKKYFDWKPLFHPGNSFEGGVMEVQSYTFDEKYVYAHTGKNGEAEYSLPKYLFDRMDNKESKFIMVGKRLDESVRTSGR